MEEYARINKQWSQDELDYLRLYSNQHTMTRLVTHLQRSRQSIYHKCNELGLDRKKHRDGYTLSELREGFHCRHQRIMRWMNYGWLIGYKCGPDAKTWNFTDKCVKKFLHEHADVLPKNVQESLWVRDFLEEPFEYGLGHQIEKA